MSSCSSVVEFLQQMWDELGGRGDNQPIFVIEYAISKGKTWSGYGFLKHNILDFLYC